MQLFSIIESEKIDNSSHAILKEVSDAKVDRLITHPMLSNMHSLFVC